MPTTGSGKTGWICNTLLQGKHAFSKLYHWPETRVSNLLSPILELYPLKHRKTQKIPKKKPKLKDTLCCLYLRQLKGEREDAIISFIAQMSFWTEMGGNLDRPRKRGRSSILLNAGGEKSMLTPSSRARSIPTSETHDSVLLSKIPSKVIYISSRIRTYLQQRNEFFRSSDLKSSFFENNPALTPDQN